jgi:hypothetical protein
MRLTFPDIERCLAQNAADLRSCMAEMQKLRLAVKRAEASVSGSARSNGRRASPRVGVRLTRTRHVHP